MAQSSTSDEEILAIREHDWITANANLETSDPGVFQYSSLNSDLRPRDIRLLEILPGDLGTSVITCQLHHVPLNGPAPRYEALSYCWGESFKKRWIYLLGGSSALKPRIHVTDTLYAALWRLRDTHHPRWMWIDAICINQDDDDEKTIQVRLMRDIYAGSTRVMIWLGEQEGQSEEAMALIGTILAVAVRDRDHNIQRSLFSQPPGHPRLPEPGDPIWWAFWALLQRPWFRRAWIVQELAVSPTAFVKCGYSEVSWSQLFDAFVYVTSVAGIGHAPFADAFTDLIALSRLDEMRKSYRARDHAQLSVMEVLLSNRTAEAKFPSDHIFAFYGLLSKDEPVVMAPDYTVPSNEVYRRVAVDLMRHQGNLDLLSITSVTRPEKMVDLPSWAPDWSTRSTVTSYLWEHYVSNFEPERTPTYRATQDSVYAPEFDSAEQKLLLRGYLVDRIDKCSEVIPPSLKVGNTLTSIYNYMKHYIRYQRAFRSCESVAGIYRYPNYEASGEQRLRAYWQTLAGASDGFGMAFERVENVFYSRYLYQWLPFRVLQLLRLDIPWLVFFFGLVWAVLKFLKVSLFGWSSPIMVGDDYGLEMARALQRKVVRTAEGYIGLAPAQVDPDDLVLLCRGGRLPIVLRRKGDAWEFIGDCYIHGLMDGKRWTVLEQGEEIGGPKELDFWVG